MPPPSLRRISAFGIAAVLSIPTESRAEEARDEPVRPLHFGGIEANALAPLAGRMGGQLQLAVPGPFTIVAGASHVSHRDTQRWSSYDGALGMPALRGWSYEIGPRFFPVIRRHGTMSWWVGASVLVEELEQGALRGERSLTKELRPKIEVQRFGGAIDTGMHVSFAPFYATVGVGFVIRSANRDFYERSENASFTALDSIDPSHMELSSFSPRALFSIGVGY